MRYKIDFKPADLLCPERLIWIPFERVKAFLDDQKTSRALSAAPDATADLGPDALPIHVQSKVSQSRFRFRLS